MVQQILAIGIIDMVILGLKLMTANMICNAIFASVFFLLMQATSQLY